MPGLRRSVRKIIQSEKVELDPATNSLIRHVEIFERAKHLGLTITIGDVNLLEFQTMTLIDQEREAWREQKRIEAEREAQMQAARSRLQQSSDSF